MARRTGVPTLIGVAAQLCKYITKYGPLIVQLYPENALLASLLATAMEACTALHQELLTVRDYGD